MLFKILYQINCFPGKSIASNLLYTSSIVGLSCLKYFVQCRPIETNSLHNWGFEFCDPRIFLSSSVAGINKVLINYYKYFFTRKVWKLWNHIKYGTIDKEILNTLVKCHYYNFRHIYFLASKGMFISVIVVGL